jgi:IS30 family transposase
LAPACEGSELDGVDFSPLVEAPAASACCVAQDQIVCATPWLKKKELRYYINSESAKTKNVFMNSYQQLSDEERYTISSLLVQKKSQACIARFLKSSPNTVSRKLKRNRTNHDGDYRPGDAQSYINGRRRRSRRGSHFAAKQMQKVRVLIEKKWSSEQISNVLKLSGAMPINHESFYKFILMDKKNGGKIFLAFPYHAKASSQTV